MSMHLSEDQFARYLVGQATNEESHHVRHCPECDSELKQFGREVLLFQNAVRERIDDRIATRPLVVTSKPTGAAKRTERWALVAAVSAVLVVLPFIRTGDKPAEVLQPVLTEADPDAVMNRVNLHLARSVPSPMQPLLLGVPNMNP